MDCRNKSFGDKFRLKIMFVNHNSNSMRSALYLGLHTVWNSNSIPTFWDNPSVLSSRIKQSKTAWSHIHCSKSLKSRIVIWFWHNPCLRYFLTEGISPKWVLNWGVGLGTLKAVTNIIRLMLHKKCLYHWSFLIIGCTHHLKLLLI